MKAEARPEEAGGVVSSRVPVRGSLRLQVGYSKPFWLREQLGLARLTVGPGFHRDEQVGLAAQANTIAA